MTYSFEMPLECHALSVQKEHVGIVKNFLVAWLLLELEPKKKFYFE